MLKAAPEVVGDLHLRVLAAVGRANRTAGVPDLRLDGGTALAAFYLGHRQSEDLDLFGGPSLNALQFAEQLRETAMQDEVSIEPASAASRGFARLLAHDLRHSEASPVKVDLASTSPFLLAPLEESAAGVRVASFRDVAAGKLHALCDRFEARDFIDLHAVLNRSGDEDGRPDDKLRRARFRTLLQDVLMIDPGLDGRLVGEGLARGMDRPLVSRFPLRLITPVTDEEVQASVRLCFDECARIVTEGAPAP